MDDRTIEALASGESDPLDKPFKPCAVYYPDAGFTEVVLADVATVWAPGGWSHVGHDMETGEIVAVRLAGDQTKRDFNRK